MLISRQLPGHTGPKSPIGRVPQSVAWGPHLKSRVSALLNQQPGRPHLKPEWAPIPETSGGCAPGSLAGCPSAQAKSQGSTVQPYQWPGCQQATTCEAPGSEHLPPSPCTQNPAGPTRSLGGRQNAQQRGAAGLGETAVPGKT